MTLWEKRSGMKGWGTGRLTGIGRRICDVLPGDTGGKPAWKGCWWACPGLKVLGGRNGQEQFPRRGSLRTHRADFTHTTPAAVQSQVKMQVEVQRAGLNRTLQVFINCWNWRDTRGFPPFKTVITLRWDLILLESEAAEMPAEVTAHDVALVQELQGGLRGRQWDLPRLPSGKSWLSRPLHRSCCFFSRVGLWRRWWILIPGIRETKMSLGIVFSWGWPRHQWEHPVWWRCWLSDFLNEADIPCFLLSLNCWGHNLLT